MGMRNEDALKCERCGYKGTCQITDRGTESDVRVIQGSGTWLIMIELLQCFDGVHQIVQGTEQNPNVRKGLVSPQALYRHNLSAYQERQNQWRIYWFWFPQGIKFIKRPLHNGLAALYGHDCPRSLHLGDHDRWFRLVSIPLLRVSAMEMKFWDFWTILCWLVVRVWEEGHLSLVILLGLFCALELVVWVEVINPQHIMMVKPRGDCVNRMIPFGCQ